MTGVKLVSLIKAFLKRVLNTPKYTLIRKKKGVGGNKNNTICSQGKQNAGVEGIPRHSIVPAYWGKKIMRNTTN